VCRFKLTARADEIFRGVLLPRVRRNDGSVFASPIVDLLQNASRRRTYAHGMRKHRRTPKWVDDSLRCSFCGKLKEQVGKLIAGPGICICDECVGQCNDIIEKDRTPSR
jgi:hypothetical protein